MVRTPAGQLLINPGSVGLQAYVDDEPEPAGLARDVAEEEILKRLVVRRGRPSRGGLPAPSPESHS